RRRRIRDPRPVDHRRTHGRPRRPRVPQRLPPPCGEARRGTDSCPSGFVCSFYGVCFGLDGANTYVEQPEMFQPDNLAPQDLSLVPVRCEVWGGCAWINLDDNAAPLRECLEPYATYHDAWQAETLRVEW